MAAYIGFSVFVAFLTPHVDAIGGLVTFFSSIPTVITLSKYGDMGESMPLYFMAMCAALPVVTVLFIIGYEGDKAPVLENRRIILSLFFFLAVIAMFTWLAFFLPPDGTYKGTRIKIFINLASKTRLGLGLIYGMMFTAIALSLMLIVDFSKRLLAIINKH